MELQFVSNCNFCSFVVGPQNWRNFALILPQGRGVREQIEAIVVVMIGDADVAKRGWGDFVLPTSVGDIPLTDVMKVIIDVEEVIIDLAGEHRILVLEKLGVIALRILENALPFKG